MNTPIRSIIKSHSVRLDADDAHGAHGAHGAPLPKGRAPRAGQKHVELHRIDNQVRALEITCSCGEKTVVELDYAPEKPASPPVAKPAADPNVTPGPNPNANRAR